MSWVDEQGMHGFVTEADAARSRRGGFIDPLGERLRHARGPTANPSDARLLEQVCSAIGRSWVDAHNVEVAVHAGRVTLSGIVFSRDEKWAIESLALQADGVLEVENQLGVRGEPEPDPAGAFSRRGFGVLLPRA